MKTNFDVKCNSLSGPVLTQLDAFVKNISYTKTEINAKLALYYLKTEIDALISNYYTKTQTNDKFALYYLKTEIDTLITNLGNIYFTKTEINAKLALYYLKTEIDALLTNYYTKTQKMISSLCII